MLSPPRRSAPTLATGRRADQSAVQTFLEPARPRFPTSRTDPRDRRSQDVDVDLHLGGWGHWPSVLQIPLQTLARMDHPARLSQLEQVKLFRYTLNVEGHGVGPTGSTSYSTRRNW